jgi:hypothetical protein
MNTHKYKANATNVYFTNSCESGKRCYLTKSLAKAAAKQMQKRGLDKLIPYDCNKCEQIHLAHPRRNK